MTKPSLSFSYLVAAIFVAVWVLFSQFQMIEEDLWLYISIGREILTTGSVPYNGVFTFGDVASSTYVAHEWLPSLFVAWSEINWGLGSLPFSLAVVAVGVFLISSRGVFLLTRSHILAICLPVVCFMLGTERFRMRAEVSGYLCLVIEMWVLIRWRTTGKWSILWILPLNHILWTNSHGSFLVSLVLVPVLMSTHIAEVLWKTAPEDRRSKFPGMVSLGLFFTALVFLASLVNPYGIDMLTHTFKLSTAGYVKLWIGEWKPVFNALHDSGNYLNIYLVSIFAMTVIIAISREKRTLTGWALVLMFAFLPLSEVRHLTIFYIVSPFIAAEFLRHGTYLELKSVKRQWVQYLLPASIACASLLTISLFNLRFDFNSDVHKPMSKAAVDFLRSSNIKGRVFNSYNYGNQLIYEFYPDIQVAIDGRAELYGPKRGLTYDLMFELDNIRRASLDEWQISTLILERGDAEDFFKSGFVVAEPWHIVFEDSITVIIKRNMAG